MRRSKAPFRLITTCSFVLLKSLLQRVAFRAETFDIFRHVRIVASLLPHEVPELTVL